MLTIASLASEAIASELEAHERNGTWTIVQRLSEKNVIDSKWVFKLQCNKAGKTSRFKARLCTRGFRQQQGIDYKETFSPVVRYDTLRVLLAIATARQLKMCQFDVKTAFLHGELKEEIYMEIPKGLDASNDRRQYVCKLAKSLYGLKQASRCWSQTLARLLAKHDLKPCNADASVYIGTVDEEILILVLFVDDGLVLAKSRVALNLLIDILKSNFEITMSDPDVFVGVQIERDEHTRSMFTHQGLYMHSVLKRFNMLDSNVSEGESEMNERVPFRELIGS